MPSPTDLYLEPLRAGDAAELGLPSGEHVPAGGFGIRRDAKLIGMVSVAPVFRLRLLPGEDGAAREAAGLAVMRWFAAGGGTVTAAKGAAPPAGLGFRSGADAPLLDRADFAAAMPFSVETARCLLEPMEEADAGALSAIVSRPEIARMLFIFDADFDAEKARTFIGDWTWRGDSRFRLAIRMKGDATRRMIGSIGVGGPPDHSIFYFLAPDTAGQGLASEIVPAFAAALFRAFGLDMIQAEVFEDNPASIRVLERAGFRRVAAEMLDSRGRSEAAPGFIYRLPAPRR